MSVSIQSKKTIVDLASVNASISTNAAAAAAASQAVQTALDAEKARLATRESAVDASLTSIQSQATADKSEVVGLINAEKARVATRESDVDASLASIESQAAADKLEVVGLIDAEKTRVATREAAVDASLVAVDDKVDTEKAALEAKIAAEKATLQANIDALASSTSGDSGALTSRISDLETKVGTDLTATINTALSDGVVQATLDGFLAKDTELAAEVATALSERVSADNAIKTKFDLLVAKLFEGLTIEGVTQAELSFGPVAPVESIYLPDGTTVASVEDIVLSDWAIPEIGQANPSNQDITFVFESDNKLVWVHTPNWSDFAVVITDKTTGAVIDRGYNQSNEMGGTTEDAIINAFGGGYNWDTNFDYVIVRK